MTNRAPRRELFAEGLPLVALGELAAPAVVAKTAGRQMLGFMNEMARFAEYAIADAGGLARCNIVRLNRGQRRLLHNRDGHYVRPVELAAKRLRHQESSNSRQT